MSSKTTDMLAAKTTVFAEDMSDEQLEELVARGDPGHDEALLRFFHRRLLREEFLLAPAMRELENIEIPRLIG